MALLDEFCDSAFWDSNLTWHSANPDFTSCFKNTALVWIPCIFLWVLAPIEIYFIKSTKSRNIPYGLSSNVKLVFIVFIVALNLIETVDYAIFDTTKSISIFNSALKLTTYVLFFSLILANIKRGIRRSGILSTFALLSVICGIPQFRTFIVQGFVISYNDHDITDSISYLLQYMSIFIILILSYFADSGPNYSSCSTNQNVCPSHNASYASKIFLSWYSRYVWRNVKKPIENNLWELDEEDRAINESFKLEKYLNKFPYRTRYEDVDGPNKESKSNMFGDENNFSTLKLLFDRYRWPIFIGALWRALDAWMIVNYPILFSLLISYTHETETPWKMYLCAFGFVVNAVADSVVMARYYEGLTKMQIRIRAALISLIYKKILRTSERVRRAYTSGEIVNLMTVDITRILDMTIFMHYLWLTPFQFILSFYFVWKTFGLCTIVSIIMMILLMPINKYLFTIMMKYVDDETMYRDRRGKFIQDLLNGVKILKMYAWEASFERKATSLRQEETNILKKSGILHVWLLFIYNCIPIMMSVISFAAYNIFTGSSIDVDKAFITISFFNNFRTPLRLMSNYFPSMMQALISLKRIDDFLNLPEPNDTAISHDRVDAALVMENATFSWTALEGSTVLHDLNLRVNKGSLISIVGCVGAGKSSLISAFLGEMKKLSGYVNVNGNIAYVPQQAWILNATLRDNITLGQPIDRFLYKSALKACALDRDLSNFPAGDLMEIGERGINLSGGQKQRITIARAICCNADIYFFDDSLSAVDVRVAEHIFQCVLGPNGILNQKTRVLVTHNTTFLSQSDQVIVLKDGSITESGSYQDLITKGGYLTTFLAHEARNMKEDDDDFRNKPKENCFEENKLLTLRDTNNEDIITTDTKLIEKDNVATSSVKREVYKFYLSIIGIPIISYVLTLNVFNQIFSLSSRLWLTSWSSANALDENSYSQTFYLSIFAAFGLTEALSAAIANRLLLKGIYDATSTIYNQMISSVLKWPLWLLDSTPVGRIMNRATSDIHILDSIACKRSVAFLELGHRFLFILLILCYIMPINILIFTSVFVTVYFFQHRYHSLNSQLKRINFNNMAPLSSFIVETIHGLSSIRANRFQKKFIAMLYEKVDLYSSGMLPTGTCYRWCTIRLESLYGFAVFLVIVLILRQKDILGHGMVCFAISYAIQWTKEFQWFLCYLTELHDSTISVERIKEYIDLPQENIDKKSQAIPTRWPHRGEIQFQNYKLRYRQCDDMVLKGLTFSIKSGEKIGIIGRTGAGKSSLILGLLRLVEPADGTIVIDNIDIRHLDLKILRSRLTIIPQDPVLFLGTLRFNLDPMEKHPDESLWNALEKAHLKQFVKDLPNGLEYHIDEGGENLSCGQKQLLCLARALLRKSKILILDEATASVDIETDELIQNTIRTEFNQCTVLTVAHRVHTIQDYDRILVMEAGRVIEYDTPENLLNKKNSSLFYKVMLKSGLITQ